MYCGSRHGAPADEAPVGDEQGHVRQFRLGEPVRHVGA